MSKFTNGTWSVGISEKYGPYVYADDGDAIIAVIRNCGHISELSEKEAVRQANARLIAAAPELYKLLKEELIPTSDYGVIVNLAREAKLRELFNRIEGEEVTNE